MALDPDAAAAVIAWLDREVRSADWPAMTLVKHSTVRTVSCGTLVDPDSDRSPWSVHVKVFRPVRLSDRARDALRGTRSWREFANLRLAADRGLPVVRPLAAGRILGDQSCRSFLLTETAPGEPMPRSHWNEGTAAAAGRLLQQAHSVGLHADDLHPGNLLWQSPDRLTLLDLTSARFANPLDDADRARGLAFFCLHLDGLVRDPDATPLLAAYGAGEHLVERAQRHARRLRSRALAAFGRRAFRPCHHTEVRRRRGAPRWYLHRPAESLWPEVLALPDQLEQDPPIKHGRRGAVYLMDRIVAKRRSAAAARRLFRAAYYLLNAGVPIPLPIAVTTYRGGGWYYCQRLTGADLASEIANMSQGSLDSCAADLGRSLARLHAMGLRNRDLKFENLMRGEGDRVYLVDLDGVRRNAPADRRGQAADLGRLLAAHIAAASPGGPRVWRIFLRSYTRACQCLQHPLNLRPLLRRIVARAHEWASAHPNTLC